MRFMIRGSFKSLDDGAGHSMLADVIGRNKCKAGPFQDLHLLTRKDHSLAVCLLIVICSLYT